MISLAPAPTGTAAAPSESAMPSALARTTLLIPFRFIPPPFSHSAHLRLGVAH